MALMTYSTLAETVKLFVRQKLFLLSVRLGPDALQYYPIIVTRNSL